MRAQVMKLKDEKVKLNNSVKELIEHHVSQLQSKRTANKTSIAPLNEELVNKSMKRNEVKEKLEIARTCLEEKKLAYDAQVTL